uniref:Uncharacterized protein n=1 Tax=Anopheles funestus TaxID=62324 RepID=A0A4Y0BLQ1_ANOFN
MAFKFVAFAALVAVAHAGLIASPAVSYAAAPALVAAPVAKVAYAAQPEEYDPNPQYSFSYGISDALTGDSSPSRNLAAEMLSRDRTPSLTPMAPSVLSSTRLTHTTDSTLSSTVSLWPPRSLPSPLSLMPPR